MHPDTLAFLDVLFQHCTPLRSSARLTFTVIHPTSQQPTPSRHIPLENRAALLDTLQRLSDTNRMGWGAYFAVGLRKPGLGRWKRGDAAEVVALPAFYTDIDDPTDATLMKLRGARLPPSMIVHSGGGYHAYWLLDEPTRDEHRTAGLTGTCPNLRRGWLISGTVAPTAGKRESQARTRWRGVLSG